MKKMSNKNDRIQESIRVEMRNEASNRRKKGKEGEVPYNERPAIKIMEALDSICNSFAWIFAFYVFYFIFMR